MNASHGAMPAARSVRLAANAVDIDFDIEPHIGAALANGIPQVFESQVAILTSVTRDDVAAAAPHQLVDTEILEVSAVRKIHEVAPLVGQAKQLTHEVDESKFGRRAVGLFTRRIAEPPSEAHIEHRHEKGSSRRGVVSLVGTGGGAGNGHSGAEGNATELRVSVMARLAVAGTRGSTGRIGTRIAARSGMAGDLVTAEFGSEDEGSPFALLPRQILTAHQVERRVHEGIRACEPGAGQVREPHVVVRIKTRKALRLAHVRGAEVTAYQPVAIEMVHRKLVDVDAPG